MFLTKPYKGNVVHGVCEIFMDKNLADPDLSPGLKQLLRFDFMETRPPVWLLGLPPVVKAKHNGEGAGGQHLLVLIVVQAVGCCQCKSVANLKEKQKM